VSIELFHFMEEHRDAVVRVLTGTIPKQIPAFTKVPRHELRENLEYVLDAYVDMLVTGLLPQVLRTFLQEQYGNLQGEENLRRFNKSMAAVEKAAATAACTFTDIFQDHLNQRIREHNDYLTATTRKLGVDLSRFILFKG
jgi:hypothetical protein